MFTESILLLRDGILAANNIDYNRCSIDSSESLISSDDNRCSIDDEIFPFSKLCGEFEKKSREKLKKR